MSQANDALRPIKQWDSKEQIIRHDYPKKQKNLLVVFKVPTYPVR